MKRTVKLTWIRFLHVTHLDSDDLATARAHQELTIRKNLGELNLMTLMIVNPS